MQALLNLKNDIEINKGLAITPGENAFRIWPFSNKIHYLLQSL